LQVTRFTSLVGALALIWIALAFATDGIFLTPRNLYNLSIQTCVTAIMACGMVYVIAARQIDLSVGLADGLHGHADRLRAGRVAGRGDAARVARLDRDRRARRASRSGASRDGGSPTAPCPRSW
jgi:hypothetical protein